MRKSGGSRSAKAGGGRTGRRDSRARPSRHSYAKPGGGRRRTGKRKKSAAGLHGAHGVIHFVVEHGSTVGPYVKGAVGYALARAWANIKRRLLKPGDQLMKDGVIYIVQEVSGLKSAVRLRKEGQKRSMWLDDLEGFKKVRLEKKKRK